MTEMELIKALTLSKGYSPFSHVKSHLLDPVIERTYCQRIKDYLSVRGHRNSSIYLDNPLFASYILDLESPDIVPQDFNRDLHNLSIANGSSNRYVNKYRFQEPNPSLSVWDKSEEFRELANLFDFLGGKFFKVLEYLVYHDSLDYASNGKILMTFFKARCEDIVRHLNSLKSAYKSNLESHYINSARFVILNSILETDDSHIMKMIKFIYLVSTEEFYKLPDSNPSFIGGTDYILTTKYLWKHLYESFPYSKDPELYRIQVSCLEMVFKEKSPTYIMKRLIQLFVLFNLEGKAYSDSTLPSIRVAIPTIPIIINQESW